MRDILETVVAAIDQQCDCDVIVLTGGVSMGETDYVPKAILANQGDIVFHRIPVRPGKPIMGAVGPRGQLWLGLPGNPVSVAATGRCILWPFLRKIAGLKTPENPQRVTIDNPDSKTIPLVWFRLARRLEGNRVELIQTLGSGDVISLGSSDGVVRIDPLALPSNSDVAFYPWQTS